MFTPRRHRGVEILDASTISPALRERSLRDVTRSNVLFGGRRAACAALQSLVRQSGATGPLTLLDVGCGLGDLSAAARDALQHDGILVQSLGIDEVESLVHSARSEQRIANGIAADALTLPLRDRSIDIALCSQLLHHFAERDAITLLGELHRVARVGVVVSDLRRSWIAAAGFWLASWPLGFHRITRHDGVLSVLRGFTANELDQLARAASHATPHTTRRLGWRLTTTWRVAA